MDAVVARDTYTIPVAGGVVARLVVFQYQSGDVSFIAAPDKGDKDETAALAAIAILKEQCELRSLTLRTLYRRYRPSGHGRVFIDVPDAVIVTGWSERFMELLELIQHTGSLTVH